MIWLTRRGWSIFILRLGNHLPILMIAELSFAIDHAQFIVVVSVETGDLPQDSRYGHIMMAGTLDAPTAVMG